MTLPDRCDVCAYPIFPWDLDEPCKCGLCGAWVQPWEALSPDQVHRRMRLIAKREAIDAASTIKTDGNVL